jgi:hypothetical protein
VPEQVRYATVHSRCRSLETSILVDQLLNRYREGGVPMTMKEFRQYYLKEHLHELRPEEMLQVVSPEELLKRLPPEERLKGLPPEVIENYLKG